MRTTQSILQKESPLYRRIPSILPIIVRKHLSKRGPLKFNHRPAPREATTIKPVPQDEALDKTDSYSGPPTQTIREALLGSKLLKPKQRHFRPKDPIPLLNNHIQENLASPTSSIPSGPTTQPEIETNTRKVYPLFIRKLHTKHSLPEPLAPYLKTPIQLENKAPFRTQDKDSSGSTMTRHCYGSWFRRAPYSEAR